jgi:uncharacterized membrane protein YjjP (DUF1212 family)
MTGTANSQQDGDTNKCQRVEQDVTNFRSIASVNNINKKVYKLALNCDINKNKLARLLFETYSDRVLERLNTQVSSCDKPNNMENKNEMADNTSAQEEMKEKKKHS